MPIASSVHAQLKIGLRLWISQKGLKNDNVAKPIVLIFYLLYSLLLSFIMFCPLKPTACTVRGAQATTFTYRNVFYHWEEPVVFSRWTFFFPQQWLEITSVWSRSLKTRLHYLILLWKGCFRARFRSWESFCSCSCHLSGMWSVATVTHCSQQLKSCSFLQTRSRGIEVYHSQFFPKALFFPPFCLKAK